MDIEDLELKANLHHKADELEGLLQEAPDCLRKRMCLFMNSELIRIGDESILARQNNDLPEIGRLHLELQVMNVLNELQDHLPGE